MLHHSGCTVSNCNLDFLPGYKGLPLEEIDAIFGDDKVNHNLQLGVEPKTQLDLDEVEVS